MITCSVCGKENNDLAIVCSECGSYVQGRVDALNLFSTIWGLIETPGATLKRIVLAKHKNYALTLSMLFGVSLLFCVYWLKELGDFVPKLSILFLAAIVIGPVVGIVVVFLLSIVFQLIGKALGGIGTRRSLFAVQAYVLSPLVLVLVFIVPLELAIFGIDFFGTNPSPFVIKPLEYSLLLVLHGIGVLWSVVLMIRGITIASNLERPKMPIIAVLVIAVIGAFILGVIWMPVEWL